MRAWPPRLHTLGLTLRWLVAFGIALLLTGTLDLARDPVWSIFVRAIAAGAFGAYGVVSFIGAMRRREGRWGLFALLTVTAPIVLVCQVFMASRPNSFLTLMGLAWLISVAGGTAWIRWVNLLLPGAPLARPRLRMEIFEPPARERAQ